MGLPIKVETRTGDTPVSRRQRQRRYPPDILLTTPEQLALLLSSDDAPYLFSSLKRIVLDELHALVTSKRGDLLSLGLARLWRLAPELRAIGLSATVAEPEQLARFLVPQPDGRKRLRRHRHRRRRGAADRRDAGHARAPALGRPHRAPRARRNLRADQAQQDHARLRQHPQPGRDAVPGSLAHERRRARDRAASRLARRRPAPQGRGRDVGGKTARRGLHLLARSRRRLGRRRSRHQYRRAQGLVAADAANRPRQSPPRRGLARRSGAGQPLRGAGMLALRSMPSPRMRRIRRRSRTGALDVLAQHVLGRACGEPFSVRRALCRGADGGALCQSHAHRFRRRRRFRRHRRLCAENLRALRAHQAGQAAAAGASPIRGCGRAIASMSAPSSKRRC